MRAYLRERGIACAPRELRELQAAFDTAWRQVAATHTRSGAEQARLRDGLAHEIIRLRQRGMRDPRRLAKLAIAWISAADEGGPSRPIRTAIQ